MARELKSVDVTDNPELLRLAEEVGKTGETRVLRKGDRRLARIVPVAPRKRLRSRKMTDAEREAFLSTFGGWSDVDAERLLEDIYAGRDAGERPPPYAYDLPGRQRPRGGLAQRSP